MKSSAVASIANGTLFRYVAGGGALGPPGRDVVATCCYHRDCVRLLDCRGDDPRRVAEMMRALGWVQLSRSQWACAEAAKVPYLPAFAEAIERRRAL